MVGRLSKNDYSSIRSLYLTMFTLRLFDCKCSEELHFGLLYIVGLRSFHSAFVRGQGQMFQNLLSRSKVHFSCPYMVS